MTITTLNQATSASRLPRAASSQDASTQDSYAAGPRPEPTTSLPNKLACGAVISSGIWLAANIALQAAATGSLPGALGVAAGSLAAMAAGHVSADLTSGIFHHWIDNYPTYKTPIVGDLAYEFQVHHHKVQGLQDVTIWESGRAAIHNLAGLQAGRAFSSSRVFSARQIAGEAAGGGGGGWIRRSGEAPRHVGTGGRARRSPSHGAD
jgi:hypothetical protein